MNLNIKSVFTKKKRKAREVSSASKLQCESYNFGTRESERHSPQSRGSAPHTAEWPGGRQLTSVAAGRGGPSDPEGCSE